MITLSAAQEQAVEAVLRWWDDPDGKQVFRLFGYAGTGKTTIWETVRKELADRGAENIITCAFTGKAASVLRKKGTPSAMTFHAAVFSPVQVGGHVKFIKNEFGPAATADLVGLDECSMIGDDDAEALMSFGKRIFVMGDPGQLPPIKGKGAFINPKHVPDVFLTEIHRQAAESPIIKLATMARMGEYIPAGDYGDGVQVVRLTAATANLMYEPDTMPICGKHATRYTITREWRKRLRFGGELPVSGEKVMCMRNDAALGIYNGGLGVAVATRRTMSGQLRMSLAMEDCTGDLDDLTVSDFHFAKHFDPQRQMQPNETRGMVEMDWAYVITCHKAQGSEWPHCTIVDDSGFMREDRHKWLYTAITRASQGLTLLTRS